MCLNKNIDTIFILKKLVAIHIGTRPEKLVFQKSNIPYKDTKLKKVHDRLAFLLNLYQIMFLDYNFNTNLNKVKSKGGMLSFLAYDIGINYQFKDMTLNHLEIKHVIFRNNKPVPGSYMRLLYQSDQKCNLLPNFDDLRPLLILYEIFS